MIFRPIRQTYKHYYYPTNLVGYFFLTANGEHRLVYKVEGKKGVDQKCCIIQCRFQDTTVGKLPLLPEGS